MDIALIFRPNSFDGDIRMDGSDLQVDVDLETSITVSIFTDRRARSDDFVENGDRKGWWADTYLEVPNDKYGSRLWLLSREKQMQSIVNRARAYVVESLQWMLEDKVAERVDVEAEIVRMGVLGIHITVYRPTGVKSFKYQYAWDQI
jgi:phage gp46-like protein